MTPIEIMALVVVVLVAVKLIFMFTNPQPWINFFKKIYANSLLLALIGGAITVVTGYYLFQQLTVVQVFATILFIVGVAMMTHSPFSNELITFGEGLVSKPGFKKKIIFPVLIWGAMLAWVVCEIFFQEKVPQIW